LQRAHLVLGVVDETIPQFIKSKPSPVAFISFDLDYYTSTVQALKLLEGDPALLLPRIYCYFDDIMGFTYSEYNGERLAISEFNASHDMRKISMLYGLRYHLPSPYSHAQWSEQFYIAHIFDHDLYCEKDNLGGASWLTDLKLAPSTARDKLMVEGPELSESLQTENRNVGTLPDIQRLPDSSTVSLGEHDHLLDLIDDTVITRTLEGRIHLWNRQAEELYGWRKEEAVGRVSHHLLQTRFPQPLREIDSELVRNGRWQGKLVHTTRDGDRVVVESRWTLALKEQSREVVEIGRPATDL
jgi:PAS domain S-box-containing protein